MAIVEKYLKKLLGYFGIAHGVFQVKVSIIIFLIYGIYLIANSSVKGDRKFFYGFTSANNN
jgi:hypothetical protein